MGLVAQADYVQWRTGSRLYTLEDETRSSFTKSETHYPCNTEFEPQLYGRGYHDSQQTLRSQELL